MKVKRFFAPIVFALVALLLVAPAQRTEGQAAAAPAQKFSFALIGDLGYSDKEELLLDNVFADLNRESSLAFVVHVGDLSSPPRSCSEELWARRMNQFRASVHPFIFTPGDNDWTDCHEPRFKNGDPLERLGKLRSFFFEGERTLGQKTFDLSRQSLSPDPAFATYRENVRWDFHGALLHESY